MNYLNTQDAGILYAKVLNDRIYVDKSLLIREVSSMLGTSSRYICITRPRRFGKSVNLHMLGAYYTKGQDCDLMFQKLKISKTESYRTHLNNHNVVFIDFSRMPDGCRNYEDYVKGILNRLREDLIKTYPFLKEKTYDSISEMFRDSKESFVFLLDEWDSIFYKDFMTRADKNEYLGFLKNLLKDQPYVELAYMTGVLPIVKYSSGSELNMYDEYSFMNDNIYDKYFGFSESEVRSLCELHSSVSYEDLEYWYNGYYTATGDKLFNPRSVSKALTRGVCLNYWTETGPMNEIADCIENNTAAVREDIVKMVAGIEVEVDLHGYSAVELQLNSRDEILSAMVVYGFLSYHDGYLRIPNHELMEKYQRVLARESMGEVKQIVEQSREMLKATLEMNAERVARILEEVHDREIPFLQYNDENSLSCVITLCYLSARTDYYVEREAKSGKGYCDYLFLPKKNRKPAIILELKVDDSCENALKQVKEKGYLKKAQERVEKVIIVGVNYDKKKKRHECVIEQI